MGSIPYKEFVVLILVPQARFKCKILLRYGFEHKIHSDFPSLMLLGEVRSDLAALDLTSSSQTISFQFRSCQCYQFPQKHTNKEYLCAE